MAASSPDASGRPAALFSKPAREEPAPDTGAPRCGRTDRSYSWLDHVVCLPQYRAVGWALTLGPFILVATMSGSALAATTGLGAAILLLATATAGFHDLAALPTPVTAKS